MHNIQTIRELCASYDTIMAFRFSFADLMVGNNSWVYEIDSFQFLISSHTVARVHVYIQTSLCVFQYADNSQVDEVRAILGDT